MFGKKKKAAQEKEQALARLEKIGERLEGLEGILYAQDNPEKVFDVISHSETPKDILNNLKKQWEGMDNLEQVDFKVDYIVTHTAPTEVVLELVFGLIDGEVELRQYLQ